MGAETAPLLIAVPTVGVALAGLTVGLFARLRRDIRELRHDVEDPRQETGDLRRGMGDLRRELGDLRERVAGIENHIEDHVARLDSRVARLEGMMDGLRAAVAGGVRRSSTGVSLSLRYRAGERVKKLDASRK